MTKRSRWMLKYTFMFLVMAFAMLGLCLVCGKTLIWSHDDYAQDFTVLGYVGQRVRALFAGEGVKLVDFSLGLGSDTLTTLSYYGFTDPLFVLGAFASLDTLEYVYMFIAFLRLYLAGLALGVYLKEIGVKDDFGLVLGITVYMASSYNIYMLGRFTYFISGGLYLCLVLTGIERLIKSDKPFMYILCAGLMVCVNFYFGFMNTVIAIIYISARLVFYVKEKGVKPGFIKGIKLLSGYVLALMLSAVILLPVAKLYLINARAANTAGYTESSLHYSLWKYAKMIFLSLVPVKEHYYALMPVALMGAAGICFIKGNRSKQLAIALILCVIGLCVPFFGNLMNGFSYPSDRWSYAFIIFVAAACALGINKVMHSKRLSRAVALVLCAYAVCAAAFILYEGYAPGYLLAPLMCISGGAIMWFKPSAKRLICAYTCVCVATYSIIMYVPFGGNYISEQLDTNVAARIDADDLGQYAMLDEDVYRVSTPEFTDSHALLKNYRGVGFYWSLIPETSGNYYIDLGHSSMRMVFFQNGLSPSARMSALADVRYMAVNKASDYLLPYGYTLYTQTDACDIYKNENELALGYAFESVMSIEEYASLPVEQKLQAITKCAVCDCEGLPTAFTDTSYTLEYTVQGSTLRFEAPENAELYLIIEAPETDANIEDYYYTSSGKAMFALSAAGDNFYTPRSVLALYLGTETDFVTLPEGVRYAEMRVVALPVSDFETDISALKNELLTDVELQNNRLSGRISVSGDRVLQIAVPYSEGWSAYVDGEKTEVFVCGGMYMGVRLSEGEHEIELTYITPGLIPGAAITALALIITLTLALLTPAKRKRRA